MGDCSDNIGTICSKKVNMKCTKYTGNLSDKSELDNNTCHTGHAALEDIYTQLNELFSNLDFSSLGQNCLDYEGENSTEYLENILFKFEETICDLKETVSKKGLDLSELDTKCLKDACDTSPTELLDVLQLLIDRSCEDTTTTPVLTNDCECCPKNVMYYENSGADNTYLLDGSFTSFITNFSNNTPNNTLEFIATEQGRYKIRWIGVIKTDSIDNTQTYATETNVVAFKGVGTQFNNPTNSNPIPYSIAKPISQDFHQVGGTNFTLATEAYFEYEVDIILQVGESVAVSLQDKSGLHYLSDNLLTVDKLCTPTAQT